jgi:hypothetical protein
MRLGVGPNYVSESRMRVDGVWSGDVEILAACGLIGCDIYVYSSVNDASPRWLRFHPMSTSSDFPSAYALYINHRDENHYEPVLDLL